MRRCRCRCRCRSERGAAALEAVVIVGLVLVPMVLALVTAARWVEHRAAATAAADEIARSLVVDPEGADAAAAAVVLAVERGHGLEPGSLWVQSIEVGEPGGDVIVTVVAVLPALTVPFGSWGATEIVAVGQERRPDHGAS